MLRHLASKTASKTFIRTLIAACAAAALPAAHAELQGRDLDASAAGYEAFYDTVLGITWLADANYAKTSGFSATGEMNWQEAADFAAQATPYGITGWRLPKVVPVNGDAFQYEWSYDGSTDLGYNYRNTRSEMPHMFHANLGLKSYYDESGIVQPGFGRPEVDALQVPGLPGSFILNLGPRHGEYWAGTAYENEPGAHWVMDFEDDGQTFSLDIDAGAWGNHAWLVRDGDVTAVPEPGSAALGAVGMAALAVLGASRRRTAKNSRAG